MYLLSLNGLIADLRSKDPEPRETIKYFALYFAWLTFIEKFVEYVTFEPQTPARPTLLLSLLIGPVLGYFIYRWILDRYWFANGAENGRFFWDRLLRINLVVSLRIGLVLIPVTLILLSLSKSMKAAGAGSPGFLLFAAVVLFFGSIVWLYKSTFNSLREIAAPSPQTPSAADM
jgi:hypothetical protein